MDQGTEILLWLLVMAIIAIRGAAQNRRRAMQREAEQEHPAAESDAGSRPARIPGAAAKRTGLLDRMMEYATELERQAREQEAELARRAPGRDAPERTVVVPGRRVSPTRVEAPPSVGRGPAFSADDIAVAPDAEITRPWRLAPAQPLEVTRIARGGGAPSEPEHETSVRRPRRPGLSRLDRYAPLKRAIALAEVLGRPPGFDGVGAVERRWSEDGSGGG